MDIKSPPAKRQRLPTSSRHVWMLSSSCDKEFGDEYQIYFVDLDLNSSNINTIGDVDMAGYSHIVPIFRYDGHMRPRAFCILGSTLYIFEGYEFHLEGINYRGKSALKFELCPTRGSNKKFEDCELERLPDMHSSKAFPAAIPTPDGKKILVFAVGFVSHELEEADATHFELYDPLTNSWEILPEIPSHYNLCHPHFFKSIEAYSFIDEHLFYIQLSTGMVVLDLKSLEKGWELVGDPRLHDPCIPWRSGYFPTINNKFVFLYGWIHDLRRFGLSRDPMPTEEAGRAVFVQVSSFPEEEDPYELGYAENWSVAIVGHEIDKGVVHWCALNTKTPPLTKEEDDLREEDDPKGDARLCTRVLIDAYITDLAKLDTSITKSLSLLIDHHTTLSNLTFV